MPTYEYKCTECHHEFSAIQKMNDDKIKHCPVCEKESVRPVIQSGTAFKISGVGAYGNGRR